MGTRLGSHHVAPAAILAAVLTVSAVRGEDVTFAAHQLPGPPIDAPLASAASAAYPEGDFLAQMSAARGGDGCFGPGSACDWGWGCGGSPFVPGPGRCDDWRVGPHWTSSFMGLFLFRDDIDLASLAGAASAGGGFTPPAPPIDITAPDTLTSNFNHGAGARLFISGYYPQCRGYALQVGYLGIFGWDAGAFDPEVPIDGPLPVPPGTEQQRTLGYKSVLHSLEVNAQCVTDETLAPFWGVRYVTLAEDVNDVLDQSSRFPTVPPGSMAIPPVVGDPPLDVTDIQRRMTVDNNLIGFHTGLRSDLLRLHERFYLEGFVDGGVYANLISRKSRYLETRTYVQLDDPTTEDESEGVSTTVTSSLGYNADRHRMAFVGEALLGGVYEINECSRARIGYQVLYLTGLEFGNEAFIAAGPTNGDLLMHGWFCGIEYQR